MKVIMVRPSYDNVTRTMNGWAARAIETISITDDLTGELAVEPNLRISLRSNLSTEVIAFYGHGKFAYLLGHSSGASSVKPIVNVRKPGVRPSELRKRCLYAVACHAGARLGPALAAEGCHFVGYNRKFSYVSGFEEDFENVANRGLIALATQGKTNTQVLTQLKVEWAEIRDDASTGSKKNLKNAFLAALAAKWNHDCACSY
jgi:hypothetical protein